MEVDYSYARKCEKCGRWVGVGECDEHHLWNRTAYTCMRCFPYVWKAIEYGKFLKLKEEAGTNIKVEWKD